MPGAHAAFWEAPDKADDRDSMSSEILEEQDSSSSSNENSSSDDSGLSSGDDDDDSSSSSSSESSDDSSDDSSARSSRRGGLITRPKKRSSSSSSSASGDTSRSSSRSSSASDSSDSSSSEESSDDQDLDFEARHARALKRWGYDQPSASAGHGGPGSSPAAKQQDKRDKKKVTSAPKPISSAPQPEAQSLKRNGCIFLANQDNFKESLLLAKLKDVVSTRTRKGPERQDQVDFLRNMIAAVNTYITTSAEEFKRGLHQVVLETYRFLIALQLDNAHTSSLGFPPVQACEQILADLTNFFTILTEVKGVVLAFAISDADIAASSANRLISDETALPKMAPLIAPRNESRSDAHAIALSFLTRFDDYLYRSLQYADSHSLEYRQRLRLLVQLNAVFWIAHNYYRSVREVEGVNVITEIYRTAERLISLNYWLHDSLALTRWNLVRADIKPETLQRYSIHLPLPDDKMLPSVWLARLVKFVMLVTCGIQEATRTRFNVTCYYAFSQALHDHMEEARDVVMYSDLYDQAMSLEVSAQILYNRVITQLGLCAFRRCSMALCASCLNDICANGKPRELLAQGVAMVKGFEKTAEQERAERRRLLPPHLHINLEVTESAYYLATMLNELPSLLTRQATSGRSTRFRRLLEGTDRSWTPPEASREFVMGAARALRKGDWTTALKHIEAMKFWPYCAPTSEQRSEVKNSIIESVKQIALSAHVAASSNVYTSISSTALSKMFELPMSVVYRIVSRMVLKKEVQGCWDANSETLVLHDSQMTALQAMCSYYISAL